MYAGLASARIVFEFDDPGNIPLYQSSPRSKLASKKCTSFVSEPFTSGWRNISWYRNVVPPFCTPATMKSGSGRPDRILLRPEAPIDTARPRAEIKARRCWGFVNGYKNPRTERSSFNQLLPPPCTGPAARPGHAFSHVLGPDASHPRNTNDTCAGRVRRGSTPGSNCGC